MSNDVVVMVKGNREAKVLPIDVEAMKEKGYKVWEKPNEEPNEALNEELNLEKTTVAELKALLDEEAIEYPENAKKAELLALLEDSKRGE